MHHLHNIIDAKLAAFAFIFGFISFTNLELTIKILGGLAFLGYTARRWYIMEKNNKKQNDE